MWLMFAILIGVVLLFVTRWLRYDLVALGVLVLLAVTGLVTPEQALAGFSSPAVVTLWAMFVLSAGLERTGVATLIGRKFAAFASDSEGRLVGLLMTVAALLSAFMNNIGVAALFLPITRDIARRTGRYPSRLLLPMAYGALLGGLLLLIGTATNLLVRDALRTAGYQPFGMFDFTLGGLAILLVSVAWMAGVGYRFLPKRQPVGPLSAIVDRPTDRLPALYGLEKRLAWLVLPPDSLLAGKSLAESRIGRALGLQVLHIKRQGERRVPADAHTRLMGGDHLLVVGRLKRIEMLAAHPVIALESATGTLESLVSGGLGLADIRVSADSPFADHCLSEINFRQRYGVNVLAIEHENNVRRTRLAGIPLQPGDRLLLQGSLAKLAGLADQPDYRLLTSEEARIYRLHERLIFLRLPPGSALVGQSLEQSRLGAGYGLAVLAVERENGPWIIPQSADLLQANDRLIVEGRALDIDVLRGLDTLQVKRQVTIDDDELAESGTHIVEVMVSPFSTISGQTLSQIHFREKYGLSVLALWRGDRAWRNGIGEVPLALGDALLCYGPAERFAMLARERDFVVLNSALQEPPRLEKAPFSVLIMVSVVLSVLLLDLPISIAAIGGIVLMVLTRCLTMEEAYRAIEWRGVFLIAAMLPLGNAMVTTGTSAWLSHLMVHSVGQLGPLAILIGLMVLVMAISPAMPAAVIVVLISPIALDIAREAAISPYPLMMGVAYAVAGVVLSPVGHAANVLVMSPGGYRFSDYFRHGLPIALIILVVSALLLPVLFPF
jgi:di/tricarboxylate transporter